MTAITEVLQRPDPGAIIEMFEIDTRPIGGTDRFYFVPDISSAGQSIVWQGIVYNPFPIMGDGFDVSTKGTSPRPRLKASNITGILSSVVKETDDLVGARIVRRRTLGQFLDGEPTADPGQAFADDVFFVEKKILENRDIVEWELASVMDLFGVQLPSRVILTNFCPWLYRSAECSYTGTAYFDVLGNPVSSLAQDVCSKQVASGCKKRFGAKNRLPFGGFPGARNFRG